MNLFLLMLLVLGFHTTTSISVLFNFTTTDIINRNFMSPFDIYKVGDEGK